MNGKHFSARNGPKQFRRQYRRLVRSPVGLVWNHGKAMELMARAMGFAALGFLTLVPLLIIVAAANPASGEGFARWLDQGLGEAGSSQARIAVLFGRPGAALQRTTAFGLAALAVFGLAFGSAVQTGYERIWGLSTARWHTAWRHILWLAVLVALLVLFVNTSVRSRSVVEFVFATCGDVMGTLLFFWWSQRILLTGRVRWQALFPGAVATTLGLIGLRFFSRIVFSPLIASSAVTYGPFGTVLVLQSWLVGVGFVVYGGALVGRFYHEHRTGRRLKHRSDES